ncbi:MAG: CDGSH iron-sulfur domain-containing protein [Magnetococcales bacterium]|nr:CDGSH iron-sulfur domain-containing protein [Magnetococcales bacterium]
MSDNSQSAEAPLMYQKNSPHAVTAKKGESLFICQCGHSKKAPFCDGSHKGRPEKKRPLRHVAEADDTLYVCGCGRSANMPWCDGSHKR